MGHGHNSNHKQFHYRNRYANILSNLQRNIEIADRQFLLTGDRGTLWQYHRLIEEVVKLKNHIIEKELEMDKEESNAVAEFLKNGGKVTIIEEGEFTEPDDIVYKFKRSRGPRAKNAKV